MKHVLFVAAESAPYIKTGGLGSVIGSLPKELNKLHTKVSIAIPGYRCIEKEYWDKMEWVMEFPVQMGWRVNYARIYSLETDGVTCYVISNDDYYRGEQPYGDMSQDIEKYAFFCKSVLEMVIRLDVAVDILHCHDWQSGLVPVYLKEMYQSHPRMRRLKTIMTIHNLRFQGITDIPRMQEITGLPWSVFTYDNMENYGDANMLKGGIAYADKVTTVSKNYAKEIMTEEYGEGLSGVLQYRKEDLCGIVNGIDTEIYHPEKDPYVSYPYNKNTKKKYHEKNKLALQKECGLPASENVFTMGIVSRLTGQKGYDLLGDSLTLAFEKGAQLYVLGEGEEEVENIFLSYQDKYPEQVFFQKEYSDKVAKKIYAGCDITLMPSRFEPCGLNQMMALRYGCLPLARATGGLVDTVKDSGKMDGKGDGFLFEDYSEEAFRECFIRAYMLYEKHPDFWEKRVKQGMEKDFSWKSSAKAYEALYHTL